MCFVAGFRDFLLVRDTELLRGLLAFFVTAWLAFSLVGFLGLLPAPQSQLAAGSTSAKHMLLTQSIPSQSRGVDIAYAAVPTHPGTGRIAGFAAHHAPFISPQSSVFGQLKGWLTSLPYSGSYLALTVFAALMLGLLSVLANGCPFRQHVLAAQGTSEAAYYLVGFYIGILVYDRFVVHWLFRLL